MDRIQNPFAPGAGSPPPELAGRDSLLEDVRISLARIKLGKHAKSVILTGLRGVGKTVLLDRMRFDALDSYKTIRLESPEGKSLPALLAPSLRLLLLELSRTPKAGEIAKRALRALTGFARALKIKYEDIEVGLDFESEPGLADNGDLDHDLSALIELVGQAAAEAGTGVALFVDELQYVEEGQLAALTMALHGASQRKLPIVLVGAGLPQLPGQMGRAKSYAERLFDFPIVGPLEQDQAARAIRVPIEQEGAYIDDGALDALFEETRGYPYFLQEWGMHTWNAASGSPITASDVKEASVIAVAALDESFFRVRFDRLTPSEKDYLQAMAHLGPGPHRSGDIADRLGRKVSSLAPIRNKLIHKGMIWSPHHGDTAFSVPLFDEYMRRIRR